MQRPSALGLFLCERVIVNRDNGRRTLVESFGSVSCPQIPFDLGRFDVYAKLTDGLGRVALDLVITSLETAEEVEAHRVEVQFADPLVVVHLRFRFPRLVFPEAGDYLFELSANREVICHCRLRLDSPEEEP